MRRRVARTIAHTNWDGVDSSLRNSSGGGAMGSFVIIYLRLKLLEELVNVLQVILGAQMGKRKRVVLAQGLLASSSNGRGRAILLATESEVLDVHQTLTNSVDLAGINVTRLDIAEELVEGIKGSALSDFVLLIHGMGRWRN
jgi:hypothetical protein